jgi:hypothetical protein
MKKNFFYKIQIAISTNHQTEIIMLMLILMNSIIKINICHNHSHNHNNRKGNLTIRNLITKNKKKRLNKIRKILKD